MTRAIEKYQKLELRESLTISYRYPIVCKELAIILRLGFSKAPKPLQCLLFDDTIAAFRLLPQMQTQSAISAANFLSQSVEAALPKQKRGLAATEFKQAKIAYKRRAKTHKDTKDVVQLPQDVLVHLFSFLDMQSLVFAGMVCRSWNAAANDNYLWRFHNNTYFDSHNILNVKEPKGGSVNNLSQNTTSNDVHGDSNWKEIFRRAYLGLPSWRYNYKRGYCTYCGSIVWLNNLKCPNTHPRQVFETRSCVKSVSPTQIVKYILDDDYCLVYSTDSDSESDDELSPKFWNYYWH